MSDADSGGVDFPSVQKFLIAKKYNGWVTLDYDASMIHKGSTMEALLAAEKKYMADVLKVESRNPLTAVPWANSDTADVGQWVVAIGNPFGLGGTVTAGIISARNRDISAGSYDDFIQTDAAINKGNSGGPLFNLRGEVVGINTAIISPGEAGGSVGVGFSVPANFAKVVIEQLRKSGQTNRGTMGITARSVDQPLAEAYGLKSPSGAIVTSVSKGGAAEAAGIKVGDIAALCLFHAARQSRHRHRHTGGVGIERGGRDRALPTFLGRGRSRRVNTGRNVRRWTDFHHVLQNHLGCSLVRSLSAQI